MTDQQRAWLLDLAGSLIAEDERANATGDGWDDTVDLAIGGIDLAYMVRDYLTTEEDA